MAGRRSRCSASPLGWGFERLPFTSTPGQVRRRDRRRAIEALTEQADILEGAGADLGALAVAYRGRRALARVSARQTLASPCRAKQASGLKMKLSTRS